MSRITASGGALGEGVERLLAVAGELDVIALEPQGTLERPPDGRLVIHHQNARHAGNCGACG